MYELVKKHLGFVIGIFFVSLIYIIARPMGTLDSYWVIPTSMSVLGEFNMDLDEFAAYGVTNSYSAIKVEGHYFNYFPYGMSFLVIPFVGILKLIVNDSFFFLYNRHIEKLFASAFIILSLLFLYNLFSFYLSKAKSAFLMVVMGLCTPLLTTGSRALWQHSGSVFILSLCLYLLVYSVKKNHRFVPLIGFLLAFAYIVRPTNLIPFAFLSFFIWIQFPNQRLKYFISVLVMLLLFLITNYAIFDDYLPPYFRSNRLTFDFKLFKTAILANLFSPNRGIFIWSPFLLLSIFFVFPLRKETFLIILSQFVVIFHLVLISNFPHWWGGHSVGPRFVTDVMPFFGLVVCVVFRKFSHSRIFLFFSGTLVALSFVIHFSAAISKNTQLWNIRGNDINDVPERVWDWNRPQFYPFE